MEQPSNTSRELATALLQWVNLFPLTAPVRTWGDMTDGQTLWAILGDINPEHFHDALPESDSKSADKWISRWQNLKHIDRMVTIYIRDVCEELPNLSGRMSPNLKAIATDASTDDMAQVSITYRQMMSFKANIVHPSLSKWSFSPLCSRRKRTISSSNT